MVRRASNESIPVCWLPYHLFFIYSYHNNQIMSTSYVQHLYLGLYWLAMSNAMVNPLIYYWLNRRYSCNKRCTDIWWTQVSFRFRVYFQQIICFCCFRMMSREREEHTDKLMLKNDSQSCCRQKTLSVKWRKSTAETKFSDKKTKATPTADPLWSLCDYLLTEKVSMFRRQTLDT